MKLVLLTGSNCIVVVVVVVLLFVCSDLVKTRSTYSKLIALHRELNQQDQVIECYSQILSTFDKSCEDLSETDTNDLSKTWLEFGTYLISRGEIVNRDWVKVCMYMKLDVLW